MASTLNTQPVGADTLITIKLQIGAEHKKTKLPMRDLRPEVLPAKLRQILDLPADKEYIFERYSDSAGTFVKLEDSNISVYKQLNRAAKAKLKLRLKISQVPEHYELPQQRQQVDDLPSFPTLPSPAALDLAGLHISSPSAPQIAEPAHAGRDANERALERQERVIRRLQEHLARDEQLNQIQSQMHNVNNYLEEVQHTMASDFAATFGGNLPVNHLSVGPPVPPHAAQPEIQLSTILPSLPSPPFNLFSVCCNVCNFAMPDHHWHCSTCNEGDFDLCQKCVDEGKHCYDPDHYLVRRTLEDGKIVSSNTETLRKTVIGSASSANRQASVADVPGAFNEDAGLASESYDVPEHSRTCNSCINIFDDAQCITCRDCDDYDLCISCHLDGSHGHNPLHTFGPAIEDMILEDEVAALCEPGRLQVHHATCDGCDMQIRGIRHKCLDCPDWDYCTTCYRSAHFIHPGHRFVSAHEPIPYNCNGNNALHIGVRCDGPHCRNSKWLVGVRYKCAICDDTDFCATCEASPSNDHNKTHPLIKMRQPYNDVSITTYHGGPEDNGGVEVVGDRQPQTSSRGTETMPPAASANASTQAQEETPAVEKEAEEKSVKTEVAEEVEVKEAEPKEVEAKEVKPEAEEPAKSAELAAFYISDYVSDGTKVTPGQSIYQSWTLYNPSATPWPTGCALRWAGGDPMIDIDMTVPGSVQNLIAASMSNATHAEVENGGEYSFSVRLRAPPKVGRAVSYWRLFSPDGQPFGHRLWCDVDVVEESKESKDEETKAEAEKEAEPLSESQMVFPKLEKESPASSTHLAPPAPSATVASPVVAEEAEELLSHDDIESVTVDFDDDDTTDDGFLTDEDYDMLEDARSH